MFKRVRLMLAGALVIVLTAIISVMPAMSATVPDTDNECSDVDLSASLTDGSISATTSPTPFYYVNLELGQRLVLRVTDPVDDAFIRLVRGNIETDYEISDFEPQSDGSFLLYFDVPATATTGIVGEIRTQPVTQFQSPFLWSGISPTLSTNGTLSEPMTLTITCEPIPVEKVATLCDRQFPILGQILVNQPLDGYGQPGQDRVPNLNVFNDAGNDGFDTFDILDIDADEDGNPLWYGIFLGGCNPVYVDANLVTRIR